MAEKINRRDFVFAASAACACLLCPFDSAMGADKPGPVKIGLLKDFAQDRIFDAWAKSHGFFLIRQKGLLYATSAFCTHRTSARLTGRPAELLCSKHGSRFDLAGSVTRGPARRALPRYQITLDADGAITVDPSKEIEEANWNDPGGSINVE